MTPIALEISFGSRTRPFRLTAAMITVGSAPACTLVLPLSFVKPRHLEIEHGRLLSRVRTVDEGAVATLDGYPIGAEWTLLPRAGLIEVPGPSGGGGVTIRVALEPTAEVRRAVAVPVAEVAGPVPGRALPPIMPPVMPVPARAYVPPPATPSGSIVHLVPLIVAGVLLVALVIGLLVIDVSRPTPPAAPAVVVAQPGPPGQVAPLPRAVGPGTRAVANAAPVGSEGERVATGPTALARADVRPAPAPPQPPPHFAPYVAPPPSATDKIQAAMRQDVERALAGKAAPPATGPAVEADRQPAFERATAAVAERLKGSDSITFASPDTPGGAVVSAEKDGVYVVRGRVTTTNHAGVPLRQLYWCRVKRGDDGGWAVEHVAVVMP